MRITFVLPGFVSVPMGGIKVIHEYANRLAQHGHNVTLVYPMRIQTNALYQLKKAIIKLFDNLNGSEKILYYTPDPKVAVLVVKTISPKYIPDGDAVIAVGWQTAEPVAELPESCGKKFYFLQSFETYFRNKKQVLATYHLPLHKIAISQWIIDKLNAIGENADGRIPNAINPLEFFIENQNDSRTNQILSLYHPAKIKGAKETLAVLISLKKLYPNLSATLITARRPLHLIPSWINIIVKPSIRELRNIYNQSMIFLHASHWEGWPLPVMEAIACGCAVVAAENNGVKEYLVHEKNALLAPVKDTRTLAENIQLLLENDQLRKTLVRHGLQTIAQFSWETSTDILENILVQRQE